MSGYIPCCGSSHRPPALCSAAAPGSKSNGSTRPRCRLRSQHSDRQRAAGRVNKESARGNAAKGREAGNAAARSPKKITQASVVTSSNAKSLRIFGSGFSTCRTARKGSVLAAKAVEHTRKGNVLATRQWRHKATAVSYRREQRDLTQRRRVGHLRLQEPPELLVSLQRGRMAYGSISLKSDTITKIRQSSPIPAKTVLSDGSVRVLGTEYRRVPRRYPLTVAAATLHTDASCEPLDPLACSLSSDCQHGLAEQPIGPSSYSYSSDSTRVLLQL